MAYLYRHIRVDKNEPFYIGIGSDTTYKRAHTKAYRNKHWRNIVGVTDYVVEILLDDLTWEEACEKEMEFIALYGRSDIGSGCLCNKTDGGDGLVGVTRQLTPEQEEKRRLHIGLSNKGRKRPDLVEYNKTRIHPYLGKSSPKKGKKDPKAADRARESVTCPHCYKAIQKIVAGRWHFDNCKKNKS